MRTFGLLTALVLAVPATAAAEPVTVTSFDGTKISALFTPADGAAGRGKAPVMLLTHGFGLTRETTEESRPEAGQTGGRAFRARGYHTLSWDSRGFGRSGGEVSLDNPEIDGRDVSALLDHLATRPEVLLDGPGDPRAGMHGASYGGAIQWATTVRDRRVDAIAPAISFVSLTDALVRDARVKLGWGAGLVAAGQASSLALGFLAPQGPETGSFPPALVAFAAEGALTGVASPAFRDYLARSNTEPRLGNVRAPALILEGTADTIFSPSQAIKMREGLRAANVPVKTMWFCGGHGVCLTGNGLRDRTEPATLAWMDRWVKRDASVDTGPGFEWTADDGVARSAADFPLAPLAPLVAEGSGTLAIAPGSGGGVGVAATPSPVGVSVAIPRVTREADIAGDPTLELEYVGTGTGGPTHLFAQIVDDTRGIVVGNQATPVALELDGKPHTVTRAMEGVAMRVGPRSRYRLQLVGDTTLYGAARGGGTVDVTRARISLPVGDAAATWAPAPPSRACRSRRTITISLGARRELGRAVVRVSGRRVAHRRLSGNRVRFSLVGRKKGRVTVTVRATRRGAEPLTVTRRYRTCTRR